MGVRMRVIGTILPFVIIISLFSACNWDPDRDNPSDPGSGYWSSTLPVEVEVKRFPPISEAIPGAEFVVESDNIYAVSDEDGLISLNASVGWLHYHVQCEGFGTVIDSYEVKIGGENFIEIMMNGLPRIDSVSVTSGMFNIDTDTRDFSYTIKAYVDDSDGINNINVVRYTDSFGRIDTLNLHNITTREFRDSLYWQLYTASDSLRRRVGETIEVKVFDDYGDSAVAYGTYYEFFYYPELALDLGDAQDIEINRKEKEFTWELSDVDFSPIHYNFIIQQNDGTIIYGPVHLVGETVHVADVEWTPSETTFEWVMYMYHPTGSWVGVNVDFGFSDETSY